MAKLSHADLVEVIGEKTLDLTDQKELAREVAAFIVHGNHQVNLDSLIRDVMLYRQGRGHIEAVAVSAHPLTPIVLEDIRQLLNEQFPDATSITIDAKIDPEIVGGVRIELPRQRLDLSVQAKINTFKRLTSAKG